MKIIQIDNQMKQKRKSQKNSFKSQDQKCWEIPPWEISGYNKIPSQKILGLKFLIPLGPAGDQIYIIVLKEKKCCCEEITKKMLE